MAGGSSSSSGGSRMSTRGRSPNERTSSESSSSLTVYEKISSPQLQSSSSSIRTTTGGNGSGLCHRCDKAMTDRRGGVALDVPLIAVLRLLAACVAGAALVRIHTKADAAWWPLEHKLLFNLCWLSFGWNLVVALLSTLGYAYFPSPRRACGLPPVSVAIDGRSVFAFGGPDEDDGTRRRRSRRAGASLFDVVLALSVLTLLLYSTLSMDKWWGSRYVGLRPKTTVMIVFVMLSGLFVAFFQLFEFVEAKVINIRVAVQDTYDRDQTTGRVQL
ncbi:hypothetical protein DL764_010639 [Monosporascus ibericus]|uniref:Uncharacterized protein n=1 Tax=Monosporascus ibericus TaxID=155417 RepID=A0A4Q4SSF0_9PEZI|nr:hypothetical protein DL764_010639 [Monosporascus ibericus]